MRVCVCGGVETKHLVIFHVNLFVIGNAPPSLPPEPNQRHTTDIKANNDKAKRKAETEHEAQSLRYE